MCENAHEHAFWLNIARSFKKSQISGSLVLSVGTLLASLGYPLAGPFSVVVVGLP